MGVPTPTLLMPPEVSVLAGRPYLPMSPGVTGRATNRAFKVGGEAACAGMAAAMIVSAAASMPAGARFFRLVMFIVRSVEWFRVFRRLHETGNWKARGERAGRR